MKSLKFEEFVLKVENDENMNSLRLYLNIMKDKGYSYKTVYLCQ